MQTVFSFKEPIAVGLTVAASLAVLTMFVMTNQTLAQDKQKASPLVVRVAVCPKAVAADCPQRRFDPVLAVIEWLTRTTL
jgi:hypothetical protein